MSRAKEIKEKEQLQAKLALAFSQKRKTVLSWLGDDKSQDGDVTESEKNSFLSLPVMSAGALLNLNDATSNRITSDNKKEIGTIGEFLKGDRKVSSLTKKRSNNNTSGMNSNFNVNKNDNKATIAFKNKMRDDSRKKLRKQNEGLVNKAQTKPYVSNNNLDSDDEDMKSKKNGHKKNKNMPLQFGKKTKK